MKKMMTLFVFLSISIFMGCNQESESSRVKKVYYDNGNIYMEQTYQKNQLHGMSRGYYQNGRLMGEWSFKNGKQDGITRKYYKDGTLKGEWNFENGKQHGITKKYYEDGALKGEWSFKNGKQDGITRKYYENGLVKAEAEFIDGKPRGLVKKYYEDGELFGKWVYVDGTLDEATTFYDDGRIMTHSRYQDGKLLDNDEKLKNGLRKIFYDNGVVQVEENYTDGVLDGVKKIYTKEGLLDEEWFLENGRESSYKKYNNQGKIVTYYKGSDISAIEYNNQAHEIYLEEEDLEDGLELIERALIIDPNNPIFLTTKAQLLYSLDNYKEAYEYIKKAKLIDPTKEEINKEFKRIKRAVEKYH